MHEQCPPERAAEVLRHHAAESADEAAQVELSDLQLYAMTRSRRIVWAARASRNGADLGFFAVDAAPLEESALPKLVYVDRGVHAGLEDEVMISAWSHDLAKSPYGPFEDLPMRLNQQIATGELLVGSNGPEGVELGSPRIFVRDLHGKTFAEGLATSTRVVAPEGVFLAAAGPDFAGQRNYHLYQSFYEITDRYLSVPDAPSLKQWDSFLGAESTFAPGTYQPRIAMFLSSGEPCLNQPACAGAYRITAPVPPEMVDFEHSAEPGTGFLEAIGNVHFKNNDVTPQVVAHEFGHVVDNFLFSGVAEGTPCMLGIDCVAQCTEDTPDEAPALTETIAQLMALLYSYEVFGTIDDQDCDAVDWVSANALNAETPGPCMSALGQVAHMVRDAACPVVDLGFCDKPEQLGFVGVCCDVDSDPECLLMDPSCAGKGGGSKQLPTGACSTNPGYRSNSTLEAFWQLLIGRVCAPEAPFACESIELPDNVTPSEAAARALFYALRVDSRSFRQLFANLAAYYSCEYGITAYDGVRAVFCNHKIMDCAAPAPLQCGECGDAIVDSGEACDLTAVPVTCQDLGYDGGEVSCDHNCEVVAEKCFHVDPTTAVPTDTQSPTPESSSESMSGTDVDSAGTVEGTSDPGGCGCHHTDQRTGGLWCSLGLLYLTLHSRRRRNSWRS